MKSHLSLIIASMLVCCCFNYTEAQPAPSKISNNNILQTGSRNTSADARMKSWAQHLELKNISEFKNLKWRTVGPEYIGGRIQSIAVHPKQPFTIYAGVGSGNLWKSINNGITWDPVFDNESSFAIGCVTIAPSNPDIIWVGTGEVLMARSSYSGTGVFKSADGGKSWQHMGLVGTNHIGKIVIDPKNPDIVYVAAIGRNFGQNEERGLYKTVDGGKSWKKVLYVSDRAGVVDVVMSPDDNKTLFAVSWERDRKPWNNLTFGPGSGVYKSTNSGTTWFRLTNGLPVGDFVGRTGLAIAPSNPNIIYAILDNQSIDPTSKEKVGGELYRSADRGKNWVKMNTAAIPTGINSDYCIVQVSPDNENEIYLLGNKLIRSVDGGKTYSATGETILHLLPHDIRVMHLDMHAMWIDPAQPDRLILGNDGGIYTSYDRGINWLHLNNFPIGEFYAVSVDMAKPYNIYGGTQDNAAVYGPSDYNTADRFTKYGIVSTWKNVYLDQWGGGDSYFTEPDPTDSSVIYYEHQFGYIIRKNIRTGVGVEIQPSADKNDPPLRYNWMTPYFISKHEPHTLYYATQKLLKSTDRGDHWASISPDLTSNPGPDKQGNVPYGTITTISESPLKQGLLYAGTDDGNIHVTNDDGKSWTKIDQNLPEKWVTRVRASQHNVATVYATLTGYREDDFESYLYVSDDYGNSWKSIKGNLPGESVNVIVEDPRSAEVLYIGTDLGVYVTLNRGKDWISLCNNLPTSAVHDLALQQRDLELVAATHGRSIFILDIKNIVK
jgi:photosystem II stability/assembly factor-like uncharacterized protein